MLVDQHLRDFVARIANGLRRTNPMVSLGSEDALHGAFHAALAPN